MSAESEQLRLFIEHTPAAVAMFDRDMRYIAASQRWLDDYRLDPTGLIGRSHYEIFPEIPERWRAVHQRALGGAIEHCDEDVFEREDGSTDWLRWSVVPWIDRAGDIGGIMALTEVITARKRLEARVQQSEKMAAMGRLIGGVAHDFNNMLSVILGNTELADRAAIGNPRLREPLAEIRRAVLMAAELTHQLLAFGRSEPLELRARRLDATLRQAAPMLERGLPENVSIRWQLDAGDTCARLDDTLVSMALLNLVLNARDAMPEGGSLTIATDVVDLRADEVGDDEKLEPGEYLRCIVSDTGHGMDADVLRHVRDPYFTTKERGRGAGLGLASVIGIVEQHGGALRLSSAPGRGTVATILLPRCGDVPDPPPVTTAERPGPAPAVARILLVEDVAAVREFVRRALALDGHTVEVAGSAEEALARWGEIGGRTDLLISDIVLPGIDGPTLCTRLLRDSPSLRVLLMSGYDDRVSTQRESPEVDFPLLRKPFGAAELLAKVCTLLAPAQRM